MKTITNSLKPSICLPTPMDPCQYSLLVLTTSTEVVQTNAQKQPWIQPQMRQTHWGDDCFLNIPLYTDVRSLKAETYSFMGQGLAELAAEQAPVDSKFPKRLRVTL